MRKARIATVLGGIAAATLLTIGNASAVNFEIDEADATPFDGSVPSAMACAHNSVGKACFREVGDWFEIVDEKKDDHATLAAWRLVYPESQATIRQGTIWNTAGFQTYRYQNKDLHEGYILELRVCAGEWHNKHVIDSSCSAWTTTKS
ncbi:hypothetical protein [Streptomyces asoensis]|uniref:Secreted protein n=1 Tax=Streptomyces asoensis TaxID=249586 RepID=A0ABQ3RYA7_9ACTN|nr:hypothetical protein [Streptomyces asoensis]GGQ55121.1 hypothetical protein GCM10010496_17700 [Streptomyces asoensis]GHI60861.1 hypothetical protein Saso_25110 [Streptomyces asoensis]